MKTLMKAIAVFLCSLGLLMCVALPLYSVVSVPAEDAVILHQYSRNLAETGAITYIPHGPHAEGATDFLWMLYLALGMRLHLSPEILTAIANFVSLLGLAFILLRLAGLEFRRNAFLVVLGAIALWPQVSAAMQGFCVLPFGLLIALTALMTVEKRDLGAAVSALLLCLLRPDGVVFALPLLCFRLFQSGSRRQTGTIFALCYALPGAIYFYWRMHYFHELLPLPFLVKSAAPRMLGLFIPASVVAIAAYVLFAAAVLALVLGRRVLEARERSLIVSLLILPVGFYSNIRLLQNLNMRFFFFVPVGVAIVIAVNWKQTWAVRRRTAILCGGGLYALLFLVPAVHGLAANVYGIPEWRRLRSLAEALRAVEPRGTMLTTESGLLPYYSRWDAFDAWGLNTAEFARHVAQADQVLALHPDVVILHQTGKLCPDHLQVSPPEHERSWGNMLTNVRSGLAQSNDYEAWRVPYWSAEKEQRLANRHELRDEECWHIAKNYAGRSAVEQVLVRYGGIRQEGTGD